jgi:hypothetical protein
MGWCDVIFGKVRLLISVKTGLLVFSLHSRASIMSQLSELQLAAICILLPTCGSRRSSNKNRASMTCCDVWMTRIR